jgi:hypothetical protein
MRVSTHRFAALGLAVLLTAAASSAAQAQKTKAAPSPKASATGIKHGSAGMAKAAEKRADKDVARDAKDAAKEADKTADRAEKAAKKELKDQPKSLTKGIKLTNAEKSQVKTIEQKYNDQLKALEKQREKAEKSGQSTTDLARRISALRDQERAELRAALTPEHRGQFDVNLGNTRGGKR